MDYTGTKQRWERALVVPPPRNPLRGFLLDAGLRQSTRPPAQVRLLRTVKDAQLMGVRSCAVEKGRRTPGFFFCYVVSLSPHTEKKQNNNTELNHVVSVWCRRCSRVPPPPPRSSAGFPPCARRWQAGRTMLLRRFKGKKAPDGITTHGRASATPRRVRVQPGGELLLLLR